MHYILPAVKSAEELQAKLHLAIRTHESAEAALLYLMQEYGFHSIMLKEALNWLSKVCSSFLIFELVWIHFEGTV